MRVFAPALTRRRQQAAILAGAIVIIDQLTKLWARTALANDSLIIIPGWLRLKVTQNPGAAFSLFQGQGTLLAVAAMVAAVLILIMVERTDGAIELVGLGLVLGGALGNLVDRVIHGPGLSGSVTDFIDLSFWPVFNVADSSITVGVVLLLWAARRG